jgi:RNA polymerase II subunit A-like phosphatase
MSHDDLGLTVSYGEAARLERETSKRLIQTSKLSLIVDLDQCVIQTTVDPTVGEWLQDENNPNHAALKDVHHFRIQEEGPGAPTYYVKPRPGLQAFFETITRRYEMHIYTMGTKPYALKIASIIDPEKTFFGSRILSRDENGSHTQKSVGRLFPVDTNMVVIMDDRGDVWQWCANLIRVPPFEFFLGTGDINSSFLAPLDEQDAAKKALLTASVPPATANSQPVLENAPVEDPALLTAQAEAQQATLNAQVEARPLEQHQKAQPHQAARPVLSNNDDALHYIERTLRHVHQRFYQLYNEFIGDVGKDRALANLKPKSKLRRRAASTVDVKLILSEMKRQVLKDCVITFSGMMADHRDPRQQWQGRLAVDFGARVLDARSKSRPTHVIVGDKIHLRNLTEKAKLPKQFPWIKVVYMGWLTDSTKKFARQPERPYQLDPDAPDVPVPAGELDYGGEVSEAESLETDDGETDRLINESAKHMNWGDLEGEMEDFLGELSDGTTMSGDESDSSVSSKYSSSSSPQKRDPRTPSKQHKRGRSDQGVESGSDESLLRSPLSKRKKVAQMRKSGLARSVMRAEPGSSPERGEQKEQEEGAEILDSADRAATEVVNEDDVASVESDSESLLDFAAELEQGLA